MIVSVTAIMLSQLLGEALARGLGLPAPGPVIGMALMLGLLALRPWLAPALPREMTNGELESTSKTILAHLSLLFVPAGVGVVQNLDLIARHGLELAIALVVSTVLALATTAFVFSFTSRLLGETAEAGEPKP
jgi:putative effector of murein hydrolase LrgA (UPF0299 family)